MSPPRPSRFTVPNCFTKSSLRALRDRVFELYLQIPEVARNCQRRTECCRFRLTGKTPQLTRGEAIITAMGWRAAGRKDLAASPTSATDGACPFLKSDGACGNYEHRPFGCRTHFCQAAGGPMNRESVLSLIRELESLDTAWNGDGPKPMETAVAEVWEDVVKAR